MIFVMGMWCSFLVFLLLINDFSTTANIGDSFTSHIYKEKFDTLLVIDKNNNLLLQSTENIQAGVWKSLRISFLYNDSLKDIINTSLESYYDFSLSFNDNIFTILIDLNKQNIELEKNILLLPLKNIDSKDIPIIDSVMLFDENRVDSLSIQQSVYTKSINIH